MAAAQPAENHADKWGLTTLITTWTHSQYSLAAADALSLKLSYHEHLSSDHEDHPNQHENSRKVRDETEYLVLSFEIEKL